MQGQLELCRNTWGLCWDTWDCAGILGDCVRDTWDSCTVVFGTVNCTRIHETCVRVLGVCKTIVTS